MHVELAQVELYVGGASAAAARREHLAVDVTRDHAPRRPHATGDLDRGHADAAREVDHRHPWRDTCRTTQPVDGRVLLALVPVRPFLPTRCSAHVSTLMIWCDRRIIKSCKP